MVESGIVRRSIEEMGAGGSFLSLFSLPFLLITQYSKAASMKLTMLAVREREFQWQLDQLRTEVATRSECFLIRSAIQFFRYLTLSRSV